MTQHEIDVLILMIIFGALIITVLNYIDKKSCGHKHH